MVRARSGSGAIEVCPLEVWDTCIEGRPLQGWRHHEAFPQRLTQLVEKLRRGPEPFDAVFVTGGGADDRIMDALRATGLQVERPEDPVFAAVRSGYEQAEGAYERCADVGQTSIKIFDGSRGARVERDLAVAPLRETTTAEGFERARHRTLRFIAQSLSVGGPPSSLLLAVPSEVIDGTAPTSCTYCWHEPDRLWHQELADAVGMPAAAIDLINDAVLAAGAARAWALRLRAPVLVLTIGFGVGAAIVRPR